MYCSKCGSKIDASDKFCYVCGTPNIMDFSDSYNSATQTNKQNKPTILYINQDQLSARHLTNDSKAISQKNLKGWQIALILSAIFVFLCIIIGLCVAIANSGNNDFENYNQNYTFNAAPTCTAQKTKTVMIYMVGSDLESQNGLASIEMLEIAKSGIDTSKHNVLIYTGGSKEWAIDIPTDKNCIYQLNSKKDLVLVKKYASANMGDSDTLREFITFCTSNYSADEYGLILWNHGAGPLVGYGLDENYCDLLEMSELQNALISAGFGHDKKLEFLGFDACLMCSIETAWCVKDYANYLIASQETEPGFGWDYSFLKYLNNYDSGKDIGAAIIETYFSTYEKIVSQNPQFESDMTLSCLDLSKINFVESSLNILFSKVNSNIMTGYFPKVSKYRNDVKSFGKFSTSFQYDLIDISHLVSMLSLDYKKEANKVNEALDNLVCYSKSNVKNATGVSIYHPYENTEYIDEWISAFKELEFSNEYADYISNFGAILLMPDTTSWNAFDKIKGSTIKNGENNELSIKLSAEQAKNYTSAAYYILQKNDENEYRFIFAGFDTTLSEDGTLFASYENKAVFAVNDKTNEVSSTPLAMFQVRDGSEELKYNIQGMF